LVRKEKIKMKVKKKVQGKDIELNYRRVKKYPHGYILYNVYKMLGKTKRIFLYRMCLTSSQIKEIEKTGYMITDEEVFK
jgi:hypothetical protein